MLRPATSAADFAVARRLFEEYAAAIETDLCFQGFAAELDALPRMYGPPHGALWLAEWEGHPVGCVALRPMKEDGLCEMKRLYVQPRARDTGLGRHLAEQIIAEARRLGYHTMRLDTLPAMQRAQALYHVLGFRETTPYYPNPVPGVVYMEKDLRVVTVPEAAPASGFPS